jgi:hypothetical protein
MSLKIYEVEFKNSWPYEQPVAVRVAAEADPIILDTGNTSDRMYRIYHRYPDQHVSWALVEGLDPYCEELEPLAGRTDAIWIQIDYFIFDSHRQADDARLKKLRRLLQTKGLKAVPFPPDIRPEAYRIGVHEDAFHTLRLDDKLRREPFHVLHVSEISNIPIINDGSIPEGIDFGWVDVQVSTFRRYETIPVYRELLQHLRGYCGCLEGLIDQNRKSRPRKAMP